MMIKVLETILLSHPVPKEHQLNWDGRAYGQRVLKNDMMIVRIETDDGIEGIGEPSVYGNPKLMETWLRDHKAMFLGKDPFDALHIATPTLYYGWTVNCALAGVNQALWDIIGKASKVPVYKLLGGKRTDRIKVYASAGQLGNTVEEIRREAEKFREEGFLGYKLRVTLEDYREKVRAAREGLGKDLDLMVEWNMRLPSAKVAINAIRNIERYDLTWVEEPLPGSDIEGYAELRKAVDVPISGGEGLATRWEFKTRLEKGCYGIVQPDCDVAGISEASRIAFMASLDEVLLCPHNWHNAINTAANVQLMASSPNQFYLESNRSWNNSCPEFQEQIVKNPLLPKKGYIEVPDRPGLGVELDKEALKRFPYLDIERAAPI
ncbi:mandelate racemase/muconate lactonizing enzyme family protein [Candidatus Bathyarchaeota archaeon]|nr:mandelate racemase/muconate lactonizing enzyme family protein [Candidatus Bathyarchaeota archaeon]